jgi:2-methylcitrate dehydratase PrpD
MTLLETLAGWGSGLALADVPDRVVAYARLQILSQLGSIRAGLRHPFGQQIQAAFGTPAQADPRRAAYVMAALSVGLDFDDTAYAGHLSHSAVNVPLAYAAGLGLSGAELLTAVITANECAARVTAAATLGPFRGQTASHTHLVGAVAGRLRAEGAPAPIWVSAWGIALGLPMWPIGRGFYGSDAKMLVASAPVQLGLDACDAARHGLIGAADVVEHPDGFLATFAEVPLPEAAVAGLGERWHTETFSFKAHPGSAYLGAAVECAADIHREIGPVALDDVAEIVVECSLFTALMESGGGGGSAGPQSPLSTVSFSLGYNVATALLTGDLSADDLAPPRSSEPGRWRLAQLVRVTHDPALSRAAVHATAPIGEALRQGGSRARDWVRARAGADLADPGADPAAGPETPAATFETATKRLGARVTVRFGDGREFSAFRRQALGSIGPGSFPEQHRLVRDKFAGTDGDPWIADAVAKLETLSPEELSEVCRKALGS